MDGLRRIRGFAEELHRARAAGKPFVALRPEPDGELDDVVVTGVEMFRAEAMSFKSWWLCCYLTNGERISWHVGTKNDRRSVSARARSPIGVRVEVGERPEDVVYEGAQEVTHGGESVPPVFPEDGE